MAIDAQTYLEAAQERAALARELYSGGHYCEAHYLSGLTVECLLRAFRVRHDPSFDSRHRIDSLVRAAKFYDVIPSNRQEKTAACVTEVVLRWRNDHRFRSTSSLRRWLVDQGLHRGVKGNVVKENARRMTDAAVSIVTEGVLRWQV